MSRDWDVWYRCGAGRGRCGMMEVKAESWFRSDGCTKPCSWASLPACTVHSSSPPCSYRIGVGFHPKSSGLAPSLGQSQTWRMTGASCCRLWFPALQELHIASEYENPKRKWETWRQRWLREGAETAAGLAWMAPLMSVARTSRQPHGSIASLQLPRQVVAHHIPDSKSHREAVIG